MNVGGTKVRLPVTEVPPNITHLQLIADGKCVQVQGMMLKDEKGE